MKIKDLQMIPCVSLTETSVIGNMKDRVKEMRVFGCRLNFWNNVKEINNHKDKDKEKGDLLFFLFIILFYFISFLTVDLAKYINKHTHTRV